MKTYLYRLLLFLIPLIIISFILSFMADEGLRKTNDVVYKQWNRLYEEKNVNADLLIAGDSRASCHVDPAILDSLLLVNSYNIGVSGGTISLQLHAYHLYKKNNTTPRVMLMNVDGWSFDCNDEFENQKSNFNPWVNEPDWQTVSDKAGFTWIDKSIPFMKYRRKGKVLMNGFFEYCGIVKSDYGVDICGYSRGYMPLNGLFNAGGASELWDTVSSDLSTLESFLSICRDDNVQVVFFYSPLYKEYREQNEAYAKMYPFFVHLAATWNIPILDYSQIPECPDSTYFWDFIHLNRKGSICFTEKLANDVDSLVTISKIKL